MRQETAPSGNSTANPPIPFAGTGASEKWTAMEERMGHPLLQSLRGVRKGTLRLYLPDESEVFYVGADPGPHANMRFSDWKTLDRIALEGDVALGEDYTTGHWHTTDLRKLLRFAAHNGGVFDRSAPQPPLSRLARLARETIFFRRSRRPTLHPPYNNVAEFCRHWLDATMTPSGALFHGDAGVPLEEAQRAKYRRVLGRLDPQKGEHLLDLGCSFGGFMEEAGRLGARVTGVTLDVGQAAVAQERTAGFGDLANVRLEDYRDVSGAFDDVVSLEMFETLGEAEWPDFMECLFRNLKTGGRAIVQTAVVREELFDAYRAGADFAREHIAPDSLIPTRRLFEQAARRAGLHINDVYHFGRDQALTCDSWYERLDAAAPKLRDLGYCDAYLRKWSFHFANRAALFEARRLDMIQVELSKPRSHS